MSQKVVKGVNLGGWLVLEKWITPSLFAGTNAEDEFSFSKSEKNLEKLKLHRDTFITTKDFKWIADHGLNAVRIPVGYWIFSNEEPFVGAIEYLDFAMKMADKFGLEVVIDLHGAKGSQNGLDHSGKIGEISWHKDQGNINHTLAIIERIAWRYKKASNLLGVELLNEPNENIPKNTLINFYKNANKLIRSHCSPKVSVIFSDGFRPWDWQGVFPKNQFKNIILDTHLYQCFTDEDRNLDLKGHLQKTHGDWANMLKKISSDNPMMIGEWSLGMGLEPEHTNNLVSSKAENVLREYGNAQLIEFNKTWGWFFWTFKTEQHDGWSLETVIKKGWLPKSL